MRKIKKLSTAFFVLVLFLTLSAPAMAAAAIDTTHPVSLTISYQQDGKPIPGVPFALYRVADVNAYAEFTLSGDFKNYPVRLDGLDSAAWRALAETLAAAGTFIQLFSMEFRCKRSPRFDCALS